MLVPTAILAAYYAFVAAPLYESEASFVVRNRGAMASAGAGADGRGGGMAGAFATSRPAMEEARAVLAYIDSHAAVAAIRRDTDIVGLWRVPEADALSRLWWSEPQAEWLLWYWRRRVMAEFDPETAVLRLRVQAYRPEDAQGLAARLLQASETLVNTFSARSIADTMRAAQEDVEKAEARVLAAREALIAFREREAAFDPQAAATGAMSTLAALNNTLAQARTELAERRAFMRPDNPQLQILQNRIAALQAQIAAERQRVTRGEEALTQQVASFERLELERQLADRQLASAVTSLEQARSDAIRQQVFIMRVADPHLPEWPRYPRGTFNTFTVFISLSVLFGIGWLLVVSAREHAN
ncbi:capsule biosynthesis protein [Falsiroseomonas oryziterrae]|uniref:capsule biosynthesis protein n=1 Tax=Falsiroseomonas oryziterrae TaxID=2911368 RepID=UPI001F3CF2D3|nr:capsule biosynthesis protein [Roseomonas sp. NPKOSM-4]